MLFPESCLSEKNMKTTKLWPWAKGKIIWAYEAFRKIQFWENCFRDFLVRYLFVAPIIRAVPSKNELDIFY